jgi:TonB family protein
MVMGIRTGVAVAAAGILMAGAAGAQPAVTWVEAPSVADMAAAYPAKAKAAGVGGLVNLTCSVSRDGRPRDCTAIGEQPSGMGFGFAARKLAEKLRVGEAGLVGQEVRVPVSFDPAMAKGEAPTITRPAWAQLPAAADFQASFPKTANGVNEVRVALVCSVGDDGALSGCTIDREEPAGQGYGQGALALAPKFRVGPWSQDGMPTAGAKVRVPIRYQLTQVAPPKG